MPERPPFKAAILDMDGVLTKTATVHFQAWKETFDTFLEHEHGPGYSEFTEQDYLTHVDGKPRYDGVRDFLAARNIDLPEGSPNDNPGFGTVQALGNTKNRRFLELIDQGGVQVFDEVRTVLEDWRDQGIKIGLVTSSRNGRQIIDSSGLADLFDSHVDGVTLREKDLQGKPAPDMFIEAAREVDVPPSQAAVFEDAVSGVEAGRAGEFCCVVGVARDPEEEDPDRLWKAGADVVVQRLDDPDLYINCPGPRPHAFDHFDEIERTLRDRPPALFLDYDGTLSPIVENPDDAVLSDEMKQAVERLADLCPVAIVSGRDRKDVVQRIDIPDLYYAGSHGYDIEGPDKQMAHEGAEKALPEVDETEQQLRDKLGAIEGVIFERKRFSLAVHYRMVHDEEAVERVKHTVHEAASRRDSLRVHPGKKVLELQPDVDWDKGRAVNWLSDALGYDDDHYTRMYIGDDTTDEDAFRVLREHGLGIRVGDKTLCTRAHFRVNDTEQVQEFLNRMADILS